jgi:hypothetical protein
MSKSSLKERIKRKLDDLLYRLEQNEERNREKERQTPEYQEWLLEEKRSRYLDNLDYFEGSLREYENLKGKRYRLIALNNGERKIILYEPRQFWLSIAQRYFKKDDNGIKLKDAHGKHIRTNFYVGVQADLVNILIAENCTGLIHAHYSGPGIFGKEFTYWTGYPVKEK